MRAILFSLISIAVSAFKLRQALALENLALRQLLAIYKRTHRRPQLRTTDRLFWTCLLLIWEGWRNALVIVRLETGVCWHRKKFRLFWTRISQRDHVGRTPVSSQVRALIGKMAQAIPLSGAPRIHGELLKLGIAIPQRTVSPTVFWPTQQMVEAFPIAHRLFRWERTPQNVGQ